MKHSFIILLLLSVISCTRQKHSDRKSTNQDWQVSKIDSLKTADISDSLKRIEYGKIIPSEITTIYGYDVYGHATIAATTGERKIPVLTLYCKNFSNKEFQNRVFDEIKADATKLGFKAINLIPDRSIGFCYNCTYNL
jgi:hypothetical protein